MENCPSLKRKSPGGEVESGRIGLTANKLTSEPGSKDSNPLLSAL